MGEAALSRETAVQPVPARMPKITGVIAVQNYGSSGTTLIQSLLDGHPGIISLPAIYSQQLYPFFERCGALSAPEMLDEFHAVFPFWCDEEQARVHPAPVSLGTHEMGETRDRTLAVDRAVFDRRFLEVLSPHDGLSSGAKRKHFLHAVYIAYDEARGTLPARGEEAWILYALHSLPPRYAAWLGQDFTDCRIVHMVREPLQNMASVIKHIRSTPALGKLDAVECAAAQVLADQQVHGGRARLRGYRPYPIEGNVQSVAVRLEDIHRQPRETLGSLLAWLGLAWDESVMKSTYNGLAWWNRPTSKRVSGFSETMVGGAHAEVFTDADRAILAPLAQRQADAWGYGEGKKYNVSAHLPKLFARLSDENPGAMATPRYWRRRRWLLTAWAHTLLDKESFVKLLHQTPVA